MRTENMENFGTKYIFELPVFIIFESQLAGDRRQGVQSLS